MGKLGEAVKFFGARYSTAIYEGMERVETPVGALCVHCKEPIAVKDDGWVLPPNESAFHRACFMRDVVGSVAHQQRRCSCFVPDSTEEDDPALTLRQAAEAAVYFFEGRRR